MTAPAERETSETQTPKTETPKAGAPKRETPKAETPKQPAPKQDAQPLRYTVQVLASPQTVPASSARFKSYRGKVKQYTADGNSVISIASANTRPALRRRNNWRRCARSSPTPLW